MKDDNNPKPRNMGTVRVLVAGHDLKFITPLVNALEEQYPLKFSFDYWQGHNSHDESRSRALLETADVVVCEWALGNLQWYSKNKITGQRLITRFHLQELNTGYLTNSDWSSIDHCVFVAHHVRDQAKSQFGFPLDKSSVVPNFIDPLKFNALSKLPEALDTLGMIGYSPSRKRLDRAIDLLEALIPHNPRVKLRVKGQNPFEYDWLRKRPIEREYYQRLLRRINGNLDLRYRVIFDPPGDDVNSWLSLVGYFLSPSDFEGTHVSVAEAALSGSTPVIWNWEGANLVYPDFRRVDDTAEALAHILSKPGPPSLENLRGEQAQVLEAWGNLLAEK
jgi:glycosyltransferase involved in cell wall biosynthesis